MSLLIGLAIALFLYSAWRLWHSDRPVAAVPPGRTLEDFRVTWRCPQGHSFFGAASTEHRPCPTCGKDASMRVPYVCPKHGTIEVDVEMARVPGRRAEPVRVRHARGDWQPAAEGLKCPRCGRTLGRPVRDPLARPKTRTRPGS